MGQCVYSFVPTWQIHALGFLPGRELFSPPDSTCSVLWGKEPEQKAQPIDSLASGVNFALPWEMSNQSVY